MSMHALPHAAALARYEPLVRRMARRLFPCALRGHALDEQDLVAEARSAVLEALRSYGGHGVTERLWVATRVRQRLIDVIRQHDIVSRDESTLIRRQQREPAPAGSPLHERVRLIRARRLLSLDAAGEEDRPLYGRMVCCSVPDPQDLVHAHRQHQRLQRAMAMLSERQRQAVELGLEGLVLSEVGQRMGITETRACQLQRRATQHLRAVLQESTP